ncbi:PfkB family carbohydrate kinase [Paraburkholderia youngii]|uniref:GGDEF domain-containing protein n=1 Tax=Paraburkholderia youngii TaxID=2782701 RepID=UPI003D243D6B
MKWLVAGSAHLDILARPAERTPFKDRKGKVSLEAGGTACNVAFGLRRLGEPVRLLTAWGISPMERLMASHIESTGVELLTDEVAELPLAAFSAHLTVDGDLEMAVSDMPVDIHRFAAERIEEALTGVECVIVEANLNAETMRDIASAARERRLPVYALAVSEDKVDRLLTVLPLLNGAFMNAAESERLMSTARVADASEIAEATGATLFVTRGDRGAVAYLPEGNLVRIKPTVLDEPRMLMGLGDAFSVGIVDGLVRHKMSFSAAAEHAHALVAEIAQSDACNAFSMNSLESLVSSLYESARNDQLTGLMRRSAFEVEFRRFKDGLQNTLLLIDCDRFKHVNDTLGHLTGDKVLRNVAHVIRSCVRGVDLPCRWGGDEFVVLLPRTTYEDGLIVAERIRKAAESAALHGVTLSLGIASAAAGEHLDSLLQRADAAMYKAKRSGRNAVVTA